MDILLFQIQVESDIEIDFDLSAVKLSGRVVCDSRQVKAGDIFVAVKGPVSDGHNYIPNAVAAGAAIVFYQSDIDTSTFNQLVSDNSASQDCHFLKTFDSASSLGRLAQAALDNPASKLDIYGVTGTNGKTTVASMVQWALKKMAVKCGFIGTIGYDCGNGMVELDNTTPGSVQLAEITAKMVENGLKAAAMECSSHGLHQRRTEGIYLSAAAFTNLTGDHLDYHQSMDHYMKSKAIIFDQLKLEGKAVINIDDPAGEFYLDYVSPRGVITYGIDNPDAVLIAKIRKLDIAGSDLEVMYKKESRLFHLPVPAKHNIYNCLAAVGLLVADGYELGEVLNALALFPGVPGRLSKVDCGQKFAVLVDYAHTDDALENVLASLKEVARGDITVVFGCGGDRDRTKRPRMAKAAQKYADYMIVTNDNPRTESPEQIFDDIFGGFSATENVQLISDRRSAIETAIKGAGEDDIVLIAGKGHENYQIIGTEKTHFDDSETARDVLLGMEGQE